MVTYAVCDIRFMYLQSKIVYAVCVHLIVDSHHAYTYTVPRRTRVPLQDVRSPLSEGRTSFGFFLKEGRPPEVRAYFASFGKRQR